MEKPAPSLKELWIKGGFGTRLMLAACALFLLFVLYAFQIWRLLDSELGITLVVGALAVWGAYHLGIEVGTERVRQEARAEAQERQRRIEAARSPEGRAAIEQERLRDEVRDRVILALPPEEKVMFIVSVPSDPKQIALEQRVD